MSKGGSILTANRPMSIDQRAELEASSRELLARATLYCWLWLKRSGGPSLDSNYLQAPPPQWELVLAVHVVSIPGAGAMSNSSIF